MISKYVSDRSAKVNCIGIFFFFSKNMTKKDKKRSGQCLDFFFFTQLVNFTAISLKEMKTRQKKTEGAMRWRRMRNIGEEDIKQEETKNVEKKKKVPPSPDLPKKFNCATNK